MYYLDFEAVAPHLPWFEASPPYDTLPFQYSLHIRSAPGAPPEHRFYLATVEGDWRRDLAERMLADLGTTGSIMVYSSYEKGRLKEMAERFPDLGWSTGTRHRAPLGSREGVQGRLHAPRLRRQDIH